ncbi:MAG: hypothetical protein CVT98_06235 [Bacteroidetes bacterium HGW-Bacteroidetes-15]|nr:MAG: hypothetical protein CVT98_06235 [Bacteroidetes bacterium HGW-Bacteroidetes-15]
MAKKITLNTLLLFFCLLAFDNQILAQEANHEDNTKVTFFGYISYEALFDSHLSTFTRDGELYLFPAAPVYHAETGEMINENSQLEMLSLQSRIGARFAGPDVLGAKLTGLIETDFFATAEEYKHHIRMRHAFMKLQWEKVALTMGQFWHPMFTPEVFPYVVSFGAAAPFNPLNRAPQARVDYIPTQSLKLVFAALAHGYHSSVGPEAAQRNSGLPDVQFQLHIGNKPNFNTGITLGYMWLQPLEQKDGNLTYRSNELLGAYNLQWFGKVKANNLTMQAKVSYGENFTQFVMLGGYGRLLADTAKTYDYGYANINSMAGWVEAMYKLNDHWDIGLFGGIIGALGSKDKIDTDGPIFYNRAAKLARGYRFSPRITYTEKKFMLALEYLYNTADYGASFDDYGKPVNLTQTINHRILFAARYSF